MRYFDVVIVGAGPAGLKCAETLGDSGLSVLLIEKNKIIGPKTCAGGLTGKGIKHLHLPNDIIEFKYRKIKFHVNGVCSSIRHKDHFAFTVDRKMLGQRQLKRLKKYGNIQIETNATLTKIDKKYIIINDKKIYYTYLVGADGGNSLVRKYLQIPTKRIGIGIQYIIATQKYKDFEIFFDSKLFSGWYARIFPHKKYVSIGCGCDPHVLPTKTLVRNFHLWLDKNAIDISHGKYEASIMNYDYQGYAFGNIYLTGDAAGLLSPFTGEGIYQAIISGEEVAKRIIDPAYVPKKINGLLATKRRHEKILKTILNAGRLRTLFYFMVMLLLKVPYWRKKAIEKIT